MILHSDYYYRKLILAYDNVTDRAGVVRRKGKRIKRRVFYAAGVNHIWTMDQHDKWKKYGLRLHHCVEPFTGKIIWMVIWWINSNPKYITKQYFDAARALGGV